MIGLIRGKIIEKQPPQLIIDVQGIGYEVNAPMNTFYQLPELGQEVKLFTHFIVREDAHSLFGFYTREERLLFRTLLKVNGVGPRSALTILSSTTPEEFVRSVLSNDTASLVRLPGIGKKTAERLVIEMRDKLADWYELPALQNAFLNEPPTGARGAAGQGRQQILQDAISALVSLGYKQHDSSRMVTKIDDGTLNSEELIRRALREIV